VIAALRRHSAHHIRFYASAAVGAAVFAAAGALDPTIRLIAAGDAFFVAYLTTMALLMSRMTLATMRRRASVEDEGIAVIVLMTLVVIGLSVWSILTVVNQEAAARPLHVVLLAANVPLGWFTLHTLTALHYAHVYYGKAVTGDERRDEGGLAFPGTDEPLIADFLYYAFVIGMTAQVSDVQVRSSVMRRLTLAHGVVSFFFNTVILALAVNAAVGLGR
jgi:uncharacterized membrane protein